jgi:hypothetical protein
MAVIAGALAPLLHEGLGHGVTAWLRGDIPTEITSNHLSSVTPDHLVEAAGTIVNLLVGAAALLLARRAGDRAKGRYFLWLLAALNLLPGAGYFVYSGAIGVGDWHAFTADWPHQGLVRVAMTAVGAGLYYLFVRWLAREVRPFVPDRATYNTVGRLPYYAACLFSCVAGAFDPLGLQLMLISTIPAAFGGSSGLMWADALLPTRPADRTLVVGPSRAWWIAAAVLGVAYVAVLGRGVTLPH